MEDNKKKKNNKFLIGLIVLILVLGISFGLVFLKKYNTNISENENKNNIDNNIEENNINNEINDVENVINLLKQYSNEIGDINNLSFDSKHDNTYRFTQYYKGIEVLSGGIVVTLKDSQIDNLINYNYTIPEEFDVNIKLKNDELIQIGKEYFKTDEIELIKDQVIICPKNDIEFDIIHICEFDINTIRIRDSDKTILGELQAFINPSNKIELPSVVDKAKEDMKNNRKEEISESFVKEFLQSDGTYRLIDKKRNIEIFNITEEYISKKALEKRNDYYQEFTWNTADEVYENDNIYYALTYMKKLQKVSDYYLNNFGLESIKLSEKNYKLEVFTNLQYLFDHYEYSIGENKKVGITNWKDNAMLANNHTTNEYKRIYIGANNDDLSIETLAHEYTHGYMGEIAKPTQDNEDVFWKETQTVNEAYSDIMAMIIEADCNNSEKIDGIYNKDGYHPRNIKDTDPKFSKYIKNDADYHDNSIIISKVAYLMSTNEKLNLTNKELAKIWFGSMYKLPQYKITFTDVERAVLLQAKELGYTDEELKEISNIFVSLGYPDIYYSINNKTFSIRIKEFITKELALSLLEKNYGSYKEIPIDYEYAYLVSDLDGNLYYLFNSYPHDNLGFYGGEWTVKNEEGRYQGENHYVGLEIVNGKVKVNKYAYNPIKPEMDDTIGGFLVKSDVDIVKKEQ